MTRLSLSYPKWQHTAEDLRPLYNEFKAEFPELTERWRAMEASGEVSLENNLSFVSEKVREFLKERVDYDAPSALTRAFVDFRQLIADEIFNR